MIVIIRGMFAVSCVLLIASNTAEGSLAEPLIPTSTQSPSSGRLSKPPASPATGAFTVGDKTLRAALGTGLPYQAPTMEEVKTASESSAQQTTASGATMTLTVPQSKRPVHPINNKSFDATVAKFLEEQGKKEQELSNPLQEQPNEVGQTYQQSDQASPCATTSRDSTRRESQGDSVFDDSIHVTPRDFVDTTLIAARTQAPPNNVTFIKDTALQRRSCCTSCCNCFCYPLIRLLVCFGVIKERHNSTLL